MRKIVGSIGIILLVFCIVGLVFFIPHFISFQKTFVVLESDTMSVYLHRQTRVGFLGEVRYTQIPTYKVSWIDGLIEEDLKINPIIGFLDYPKTNTIGNRIYILKPKNEFKGELPYAKITGKVFDNERWDMTQSIIFCLFEKNDENEMGWYVPTTNKYIHKTIFPGDIIQQNEMEDLIEVFGLKQTWPKLKKS